MYTTSELHSARVALARSVSIGVLKGSMGLLSNDCAVSPTDNIQCCLPFIKPTIEPQFLQVWLKTTARSSGCSPSSYGFSLDAAAVIGCSFTVV